ncbi:MAG: baseplate assembly protein [Shimia sp.]
MSASIDLSRLPPPDVIQVPDFEALLDEMRAAVVAFAPELEDALALESEPATKVLRVCAYHRMLDRAATNDASRASMLAYAAGADLDNLAALWGVARLEIRPADPNARPPRAAEMEADGELRLRVQGSMEALSVAGPRGAYAFHARTASGQVKDVSVASPAPREVVVTILSHEADGAAAPELLAVVRAALSSDHVRPLTDLVEVRSADPVPVSISATVEVLPGPDATLVQAEALRSLGRYLDARHALGRDLPRSGLHAALTVPGVERVRLHTPSEDVAIAPHQAPIASPAPAVVLEVVDG